jgi:PhzF family phenazine biosynthesis protein
MTRTLAFKQVDVFTGVPFKGNPVAVIIDADELSDDEMQRIANWTNLSETTFICEPSPGNGADYKLRIFTPALELAFAGHPTVGSAHAYIERGGARLDPDVMRMECGAGILSLHAEGEGSESVIFTETPAAEFMHEHGNSHEVISQAVGVDVGVETPPAAIYNGPTWCFAYVPDGASFDRMTPDMSAISRLMGDLNVTGFAVFTLTGEEPAVRIRCFAPALGVPEDPVTGSANGALPAYLIKFGLIEKTGRTYKSSQGREIGRDGLVHVRVRDDDRTEIGGQSVTVIEGEIRL